MPRFEPLPEQYGDARPVIERMLLEAQAQQRTDGGSRRRVDAPRNLITQAGSLKAVLTWNAPANARGIAGWKVYSPDENTLYETIKDFNTRRAEIPLPANTSRFVAVSAFNAKGIESVKVPTIVSSNTDQLVVSGTGGGTGGTTPGNPPGWPSEPAGGDASRGLKL